jgi:hypothetical protein
MSSTEVLLLDLRRQIVNSNPRLSNGHSAGWMVLFHACTYLGFESMSSRSLEERRRYDGCPSMAIQFPNLKTKKGWKQIQVIR